MVGEIVALVIAQPNCTIMIVLSIIITVSNEWVTFRRLAH